MALSATDIMMAVYSLLGLTLLNVFQRTMELKNGILEQKTMSIGLEGSIFLSMTMS